jgi:predicted transposase/invertase (TIGR01784 family)
MAKKQLIVPPTPKQLVRFDWFIKNLLRDKADFEILEGFLCELLNDEIKIIKVLEIVESEGNKKDQLDKFNRVDVLVKTSTDERIIIEVQNTKELDYLQRILYGTSKVITDNITEGQTYKEIKRVISISVVYFEIGQGTDYVYRGSHDFIGLHDNDKLQLSPAQIDFFDNKISQVDQIFPRYFLIRAHDFKDEINDGLDEWVYFLKNGRVQGKVKAKGLDKAQKRLNIANLPEPDRKSYDRYLTSLHDEASYKAQLDFEAKNLAQEMAQEMAQGMAQDLAQDLAQGMAQKMAEETLEGIATNLIKLGVADVIIVQSTNLSLAQIQAIKQKILDKK